MELWIATCAPLPEADHDEPLLLEALRRRGVRARMIPWHDDAAWDRPVPTLIRSTWDYVHRVEAFRAWLTRRERAAPLWNPASIVAGNLHKRYLFDLARRGIAITPTLLLERGAPASLAELMRAHGWHDVVVKPAVGASSFATERIRAADLARGEEFLRASLRVRDVLVQPYLDSVDGHGERALVWIDGEFQHAVRKTPRFAGQDESVSEAVAIESNELELGRRVLATIEGDVLYARVDVARDAAGKPVVMELELVEPSLFLRQAPGALDRLADAIHVRLRAQDKARA